MTTGVRACGYLPEELEEIAVPTFNLNRAGGLRRPAGGFVGELRINGTDEVGVSWATADGRRLKSDAAVRQEHGAEVKRLKKAAKDIAAMLAAQKARLERMLEGDGADSVREVAPRYAATSAHRSDVPPSHLAVFGR